MMVKWVSVLLSGLCSLLLLATSAAALSVTYLDPGYRTSGSFTLPLDTIAMAFDSADNLYTVNRADFSTAENNTIEILRFDAATNYLTSSSYATYSGVGISGLEFDASGNLFVSEILSNQNGDFDRGRISRIDSSLNQFTVADLGDFRPTGIFLDTAGNIYFPGRLESVPEFGNIYTIDSSGTPSEYISSFVGTGIAVDDKDNLLVATSSLSLLGQTSMAIQRFDSVGLDLSLFAAFDTWVEELTFDSQGNLYVLEGTSSGGDSAMVLRVSPVPEPATILLLGSGLVGMAGLARKRIRKE